MTSLEFTEWMAYCEIQPFGDEVADLRHGTATALLANLNRDSAARPTPYVPHDFIYWGDAASMAGSQAEQEPILLEDPVAQSNLIRAALFGMPARQADPASSPE
jgi:hypothetical protein